MADEKVLLDKHAAWHAAFAEQLEAYEKLVDSHRARLQQFEAEKANALDQLRSALDNELKQTDEKLNEVAPISAQDVDSIPTRRAAYSDRTAALLAKMAMLAYIAFEDAEKKKILEGMLTHGQVELLETLSINDTEALVAETDKFVVVAFRGTSSRGDLKTDLQSGMFTALVPVESRRITVHVHSGFYGAFRNIESKLRDLLAATPASKPIYLTGHSLGGALALVASAAYGGDDKLGDRIAAVYTFGAPRVGGRDFPNIVKAPHYRIVNKGDAVPLVPPNWISGYVHTGTPYLLKKNTDHPIKKSSHASPLWLALQSIILWPFLRRLRLLNTHSSYLYAARLDRIARHRGKWT